MRIALADHTTVTYHTEDESKTQSSGVLETLRGKLGFPAVHRPKNARNRRKDHHTEHGVTTIVDFPALEKAMTTFTPATARNSISYDSRFSGAGLKKKSSPSVDSSCEDVSMKDILSEMPVVSAPTATRAITFSLPEGHALPCSDNTPVTSISRGDKNKTVDLMRLNRRPPTSPSTTGGRVTRTDAPVLFVGESYHHSSDVAPPASGINLKNAIKVTTEQVVKAEGGEKD